MNQMSGNSKSQPREAKMIESILKEMHVDNYEPRVVNQLLEFAYKYVSDVLDDARVFSEHAAKRTIDVEDVRLAIEMRQSAQSCLRPPPRELLQEIAREKNSVPLPAIKPHYGLRLPPDRYCLLQPNYRLRSSRHPLIVAPRMQPEMQLGSADGFLFGQSTSLVSSEETMNQPVQQVIVQRQSNFNTAATSANIPFFHQSAPTGANYSSTTSTEAPRSSMFRIVTDTSVNDRKRKREEVELDEDYDVE